MEIKNVVNTEEKQKISRLILEALPEWFAVPEARERYIAESSDLPFYAAYEGDVPVGFICLKETGKDTVEIHVMGVRKEYQHKGTGKRLVDKVREEAKRSGYSFLQVKTVKMGMYEDYDETNRFYLAMGFKEFEVIPMFWDEDNPCQIYVMSL